MYSVRKLAPRKAGKKGTEGCRGQERARERDREVAGGARGGLAAELVDFSNQHLACSDFLRQIFSCVASLWLVVRWWQHAGPSVLPGFGFPSSRGAVDESGRTFWGPLLLRRNLLRGRGDEVPRRGASRGEQRAAGHLRSQGVHRPTTSTRDTNNKFYFESRPKRKKREETSRAATGCARA